MRAK
ncbi:hypothetical protein N7466_002931 [Penicillium verhagenii]|jgi:Zn-dependent protease